MEENVHVYGMNHIAIEVTDLDLAVKFYTEVLNLERRSGGEGQAFFNVGERQFLAMFVVDEMTPDRHRHFGIIVKDDDEILRVKAKVHEWGLETIPPFMCDFRDPFGNRIQVVDLSVVNAWWGKTGNDERGTMNDERGG